MRKNIVFTIFILIGWIGLNSVTLNEFLHPLLQKGQWSFHLGGRFYGTEYFTFVVFEGKSKEIIPDFAMNSGFAVGLTSNLELSIKGLYDFPLSIYRSSAGIGEENKIKNISGRLRYRPGSRFELSASLNWGRLDERSEMNYNTPYHNLFLREMKTTVFSLEGIWFSGDVKESGVFRSDLNGLLHPLLKAGQWRLKGSMTFMENRGIWSDTALYLPESCREESESRNLRMGVGAAYGIYRRMQFELDCFGYFPYTEHKEGFSVYSESGTESGFIRNAQYRFFPVISGRLRTTWRPSSCIQIYGEAGIHTYTMKEGQDYSYFEGPITNTVSSGSLDADPFRYREWKFILVGNFVTRAKKDLPLQPDLNGIHHPLLEKKQWRGDWLIYYQENNSSWNYPFWLFQIRSTWGIFDTLQCSVYWGEQFYSMFGGPYESEDIFGFELRSRHDNKMELFFSVNQRPADEWIHAFPPFPFYRGLGGHDFFDPRSVNWLGTLNVSLGFRLVL